MGKPGGGHAPSPPAESIGRREHTEGTETSQYLEEEKATAIPQVAASERGRAQTIGVPSLRALRRWGRGAGLHGNAVPWGHGEDPSRTALERLAIEGDSPVRERTLSPWTGTQVTRDTRNPA